MLISVLVQLTTATVIKKHVPGVPIPLHKRSSLTKPDGTFNLEKAILQTIAVKKYGLLHPIIISEFTVYIQLLASTDRTSSTLHVTLVMRRSIRYV